MAFYHISPCALFLALRPLGGVRWLSSRMQMYHTRLCCAICLVRCAMGPDVSDICMQIRPMCLRLITCILPVSFWLGLQRFSESRLSAVAAFDHLCVAWASMSTLFVFPPPWLPSSASLAASCASSGLVPFAAGMRCATCAGQIFKTFFGLRSGRPTLWRWVRKRTRFSMVLEERMG